MIYCKQVRAIAIKPIVVKKLEEPFNDSIKNLNGSDVPFASELRLRIYFDFDCNCRQVCDFARYDLINYYLDDEKHYLDLLMNGLNKIPRLQNLSIEYIKTNTIIFEAYFEENVFTEITESPPMTFTNLLAELGGINGKYFIRINLK